MVDEDIQSQQSSYEHSLTQWHARIDAEEQRYAGIMAAITAETSTLQQKTNELANLRDDEHDVMKRVDGLHDLLEKISERLATESTGIAAQESRIKELRTEAGQLCTDLKKERERSLEPMIQISHDQEERIKRLQEGIITKVKAHFAKMQQDDEAAKRTMNQLQEFFATQARASSLIAEIERTDHELHDELVQLMLKAKAFDVALREGGTNQHLAELEKAFSTFSQEKQELVQRLNQIHGLVRPVAVPTEPPRPNLQQE